ncbi:MAG: homogentisate 1,2-dioxygenase [Myxococcales bacterium]|nr:homogentisate 1,2-dioxygenase [Myxococcales bacterium]
METLSHAPARVVFGVGAEAHVAALLDELGARRVLLVAMARHAEGAERIARALGERSVGVFTTDHPQVPGDVADAAVRRARETNADWVVAHGGGTPIGVAKAIALELGEGLRVGAVPTTYAGSERTNIWGITRDGAKKTGREERVRPSLVVYDPTLTLGLDRELSLQSLFNAMAHALEALYADDATDDARGAAEASLRPLVEGARAIAADPSDLEGRTEALRGAALASAALGAAGMALHHKLAHVLGGSFGTPHAATHATLLPYTFGFNAPAAPEALAAARRAFGTDDPPAFLYDLQRALGLSTSLRALGLGEDDLPAIADAVLEATYPNPRAVDREGLLALLSDALHDRRPSLHTRRMSLPSGCEGPHATLPVTVRGAPIDRARVIVLALHGRGASADRFVADLERRLGPRDDVAFVAPQARHNTWYPKGFRAPLDENAPFLESALSVVEALYAELAGQRAPTAEGGLSPSETELAARVGDARVIPVGFSQGACLLLTWLSRTKARPQQALAFTGAHTPLPDADFGAARGLRLHLGSAAGDPWIARETFEEAVGRFREAGAEVDATLVPGDTHGIHRPDEDALRRALDHAAMNDPLDYQAGFGNALASEARPGALPRHQNSPRRVPFGLVAEQLNGTGFTVKRAENRRTWMYRLRPQILDRGFRPRAHARFVGDFHEAVPFPEHLGFSPLPIPEAPTDFLAGLTTFAGAGDASMRRGAAIHLYAANANMGRVAFCDVDGDLCVVPERGRLHVRTELGRLNVLPGELVILPRGIRFTVEVPDGQARGFVAELFDGHFTLPERGPIGANGLADERHFLAPVASFEDDAQPWTIVVRQGGRLWEIESPHSPFDVVAWHGSYAPFKYALERFNSLGSVSFDHPDPSILTVLTSPLDAHGRNAIDVAVFRSRWDVSQHTFRPPYYHRNSAIELNGVISSPAGSRWAPGSFTFTPYLTPHGIATASYEATVGADDEAADRPERIPEDSLWIQFESTYLLKVMPWMLDHPSRDHAFLERFSGFERREPL